MNWIVDRLDEPSTYNAFSGLALALGISQPIYSAAAVLVAAIFGMVGALKSERK